MKFRGLLLFCLCFQICCFAQERKVICFVDYGIGISNFLGKGANHNGYMVGTIPVENAYTHNPFGKKIKVALSAGFSAQIKIKKKSGLIATLEFLKLGSRLNLDGVTYPIRPEIVRPANGTTAITANEISLAMSGYQKAGNSRAGSTYFLYGLVYSHMVYIHENGRAIDYTRTGEFISDIKHKKQNYVQLQTGLMADVYRFRFGLQYRIALNGLKNTVLNNDDRIRPQSLLIKISYLLFE